MTNLFLHTVLITTGSDSLAKHDEMAVRHGGIWVESAAMGGGGALRRTIRKIKLTYSRQRLSKHTICRIVNCKYLQ
jgi:hypothetical protein